MDQKVAVLVDESQDLCRGALEQLRLMSNWENRAEKLIQWVLVGQPELRDRLQQPEWEHLRQRVVLTFHLQRLQKGQAGRYIRHRLEVAAGGEPRVSFEEAAMERIFDASGGAPRLINNICEAALLAGFANEQNVITDELVSNVVRDMTSCGWSEGTKFAEKSYQLPMAS
jgi:general secretion pathway protein A